MADNTPYGESPEGFEREPYVQIEAAPEEEAGASPATSAPTEAPERAAPRSGSVSATQQELVADAASAETQAAEYSVREQAFFDEGEDEDAMAALDARNAKTDKCYRWGKIMVFLFPPVGAVLLQIPVVAEKIRNGSFLLSLTPTGIITKAIVERIADQYAPYSMYRRHVAQGLSLIIPLIWWTALLIGAFILLIFLIQHMACQGTFMGIACWIGAKTGILPSL